MAKETLYAFTDINHGLSDGKVVTFAAGDVFDPTGFTQTDIAGLIENGALSRVSPIVEQLPALTADDAAVIAASDADTKPTK